jgi:hypothetical protein
LQDHQRRDSGCDEKAEGVSAHIQF